MDPVSLPYSPSAIFETGDARRALEREVLARYIPQCRWFGGKARNPERFEVLEALPVGGENSAEAGEFRLLLVQVGYGDGTSDVYGLPLYAGLAAGLGEAGEGGLPAPLAVLSDGSILQDALHHPKFRAELLAIMAEGRSSTASTGSLRGTGGSAIPADRADLRSKMLRVEQSNSSIVFSDAAGKGRLFMKLFRKLEEGINPDVEITRYLSEEKHFPHVPAFGGTLEYHAPGREPRILAMALGMVENRGDAWAFTLGEVDQYYRRVAERGDSAPAFTLPGVLENGSEPEEMLELLGTFAARAWQLGVRTGQMHVALATETSDPAFAPEPLTSADLHALAEAIRASGQRAWGLLNAPATRDVLSTSQLGDLQTAEAQVVAAADRIGSATVNATKTRMHGDYHLGQVLETGDDFVIIDFEGEPLRPLLERKAKRSPLKDVAGMLRSFHYAAHSGLSKVATPAEYVSWAEAWSQAVGRMFVQGWLETTRGASFVPADFQQLRLLLDAYLLEKVLYEVAYELNNRPTWVGIPLRGLLAVLRQRGAATAEA